MKMKRHKKKILFIFCVVGLLIIAGIISFYIILLHKYRERFLPNTFINGKDCGGLTPEEVEQELADGEEDYTIAINFRGDQTVILTGEDIGYHIELGNDVSDLLEVPSMVSWGHRLFAPVYYEIPGTPCFDKSSLEEWITALPMTQESAMVTPVDAALEFQGEGFQIIPETDGTKIKMEEFTSSLAEAILAGENIFSLEEHQLYEEPEIRATDEDLLERQKELNTFLDCSITYELPGGEQFCLDSSVLKDWLLQDEAGNYSFDNTYFEEKLAAFIQELAARVDTIGKELTFSSTLHGAYSLTSESFGWGMADSREKDQLRQEIQQHAHITREPIYYSRGFSTTENGGIGNTYIEVDMSAQHMWYYENGSCVLESDVVTGKMTKDRYTPEGIFAIYDLVRGKTLIGENIPGTNTPEYETDVAYWMPFNGAIGLHDADWNYTNGNNGFGGTRYIKNGSHGCVNLPSGVAGELFSMIEIGTPVICYYPEGYTWIG